MLINFYVIFRIFRVEYYYFLLILGGSWPSSAYIASLVPPLIVGEQDFMG